MSEILDAAYQLVRMYPGGAASLGPRMGKNATTLSHEVKGTGQAKFGLEDAVTATVFSGDLRILNTFAAECECMVLRLPQHLGEGAGAMRQVARLAQEFGELVASVSEAAADGRITANELARARKEWQELVTQGQALMAHLEAKHLDGLPAHVRDGGGV